LIDDVLTELTFHGCAYHKTGSNYICNPPVTDTDIDYVVTGGNARMVLETAGFVAHDPKGLYEATKSYSYRKDNYNFIVQDDSDLFKKWILATEVAKHLNLLNKGDRIVLFSAITKGQMPKKRQQVEVLEGIFVDAHEI